MQTILENPVDVIPPSAVDVEKAILASLLLLPSQISNISTLLCPDDFYDTTNRQIFTVLIDMTRKNIPIDVLTLSTELEKRKWEDEGYNGPYIADLMQNVADSGNIPYHAGILREKANRRKILTGSYEIKNLISADAPLNEISEKLDTLKMSISNKPDLLEMVYVPTWDNCPEDVQPLVELSNVRILSRGNIAMLTACAGAGKSSVLEAACSSILLPFGDTLGLSLNAKSMLYIDTERSRFDSNQSWQRALKRAGIGPGATIPAGMSWENVKTIEKLCDRLQYLWSRIDVENVPEIVFIDGIGDFVADPNDSDECTGLVYRLSAIADVRNIGVLVTLHNNPAMNSDKARGVLGSELWRKSESVMIINKLADGIRELTTDYSLGKNRSGSDKVASYFQWDTEKNMHVSCAAPSGPKGKTSCEREKILELIGTRQAWAYTELTTAIMDLTGKGTRSCKYKIIDLVNLKKIVKNDDLTYSIADKKQLETPDYYNA